MGIIVKCSIFIGLVCLAYSFLFTIGGQPTIGVITLLLALYYIFVPANFHKNGNQNGAFLSFFLVFNCGIASFSIILGHQLAIQLVYFPIAVLAFLLQDKTKPIQRTVCWLLPFGLFTAITIAQFPGLESFKLAPGITSAVHIVDMICAFGKFMPTDEFAVYTVAATFAAMIDQIYRRMGNKVLFPLYSKLRREASPEEMRQRVRKIRMGLMGALLPPLSLLVIFGPTLIKLLYPDCDPNLPADELEMCLAQVSYAGAGWMLQVLAIGWIIPVATLLGPICLAFGESFQHMRIDAIRSIILVVSMIGGGMIHGVPGLIWGIAIADAIYYPFVIGVYRRYSLWFPDLDLMGIVGSILLVAIGLYFTGNWQPIWQSLGI